MHLIQASILRHLRHVRSARYTDLRLHTGLESDVFKFHLNRLVAADYARKMDTGNYQLTAVGKELANNLDKRRPAVQKQPKLSVVIIAERTNGAVTEYLFQQRQRNPYYGFWGFLTGPVQWGESLEDTAERELYKQTGLRAHCTVRAFYRKIDVASETDKLLEDKLFAIVVATDLAGELGDHWQKGTNLWMSLPELMQQKRYYAATATFIEMVTDKITYQAGTSHYSSDEY